MTRRYGVALYIHYSGVWDSVAARQRPEWARVEPQWLPDNDMTSTYGAYVDELLIPQLEEVAGAYDLDGVWVDGECWAVRLDYSRAAREAFRIETGLRDAPKRPGDPGWSEFLVLQRRRFEDYVTHYVDALHAHRPTFQITSNWMYSARMPLPVRAPLDYLSGDYTPGEAVNSARLEARRLAAVHEAQGLPWDLMAWGFNYNPRERAERSLKTADQLQQEASVVLGQGGGFQIYFKPTRAGWIDAPTIDVAAQVGDFCRARQAVSHQTATVPQVALLLSETAHFAQLDREGRLFATSPLQPLQGVLHALLELHYSVDVLTEEQLVGGRLHTYPVIVIPEWPVIGEQFLEALLAYVRAGGKVLAIGAAAAATFKDHVGVHFDGEPQAVPANNVAATRERSGSPGMPMLAWAGRTWQAVALAPDGGVAVAGRRYPPFGLKGEGDVAATITPVGDGLLAAIYGQVGSAHYEFHHPVTRAFIGSIIKTLFPEPAVEVEGPATVDVALRRKGGDRLVHLSNVTGMQVATRYACIGEVPPVGPVMVTLRLHRRPSQVSVVPETDGFEWEWDNARGIVRVTLPRLEIHGVVACEK